MSTVQSKGYNPNVTDVNDPRFTGLSNHPDRWMMANLIGEGDVYAGRGYSQVYSLNTSTEPSEDTTNVDFISPFKPTQVPIRFSYSGQDSNFSFLQEKREINNTGLCGGSYPRVDLCLRPIGGRGNFAEDSGIC